MPCEICKVQDKDIKCMFECDHKFHSRCIGDLEKKCPLISCSKDRKIK